MMDDGVKAVSDNPEAVQVSDIAVHVLEALEGSER